VRNHFPAFTEVQNGNQREVMRKVAERVAGSWVFVAAVADRGSTWFSYTGRSQRLQLQVLLQRVTAQQLPDRIKAARTG
jgi:hypothetical protein